MTDGTTDPPDEIERIVDDLLTGVTGILSAEQRAETREYILDAFAAHPVGRLLAERLRAHAAPSRSGEEPIDTSLAVSGERAKASGEEP